eukprot:evm.model.scf_4.6 EVM.evm.TU.scf_4.6   scf_4:158669-197053(-)
MAGDDRPTSQLPRPRNCRLDAMSPSRRPTRYVVGARATMASRFRAASALLVVWTACAAIIVEFEGLALGDASGDSRGEALLALGWGEGGDGSGDLQMAESIEVIDINECRSKEFWGDSVKDTMFCAYSFQGEDVCQGDSGGPLIEPFTRDGVLEAGKPSLDIIVGITSFGDSGCGDSQLPNVFTKVSSFRDWIDFVMEEEPPELISTPGPAAQASPPEDPTSMRPDVPSPLPDDPPLVSGPPPMPALPPTEEMAPPTPAPIPPAPERAGTSPSEDVQELNEDLMFVAAKPESDSTESEVEDLISSGADPNACCTAIGKFEGCTALVLTTRSNNTAAAKALVAAGADVDLPCGLESSPLHWAAMENAIGVSQVLVDADAELDPRDADRDTPLHETSWSNHIGVAEVLVKAGANLEARRRGGDTPLLLTARRDSPHVAEVLAEGGADTEARTTAGNFTALMIAAGEGYLEVVKVLVAHGADVSARNEEGETAGDLICIENIRCKADVVSELEVILL